MQVNLYPLNYINLCIDIHMYNNIQVLFLYDYLCLCLFISISPPTSQASDELYMCFATRDPCHGSGEQQTHRDRYCSQSEHSLHCLTGTACNKSHFYFLFIPQKWLLSVNSLWDTPDLTWVFSYYPAEERTNLNNLFFAKLVYKVYKSLFNPAKRAASSSREK